MRRHDGPAVSLPASFTSLHTRVRLRLNNCLAGPPISHSRDLFLFFRAPHPPQPRRAPKIALAPRPPPQLRPHDPPAIITRRGFDSASPSRVTHALPTPFLPNGFAAAATGARAEILALGASRRHKIPNGFAVASLCILRVLSVASNHDRHKVVTTSRAPPP